MSFVIADSKPQASEPVTISALLYGAVGVGKTGTIGSFPRLRIIDTDGRAERLLSRLYPGKVITYATFKETALDSRGIIKDGETFVFDDVCRVFDKWALEKDKWDTVAIDTGTSLTGMASNKAIVLAGKMKLSQTHTFAKQTGLMLPRIQDYGAERSLVEQIVDMFARFCNESNKHFLFVCHEKEQTDDSGNVIKIEPLLTGKGASTVSAMFSEVWNLRVEGSGPNIKRYLQTERDGLRTCRSDIGVPTKTAAKFEAVINSLKKEK